MHFCECFLIASPLYLLYAIETFKSIQKFFVPVLKQMHILVPNPKSIEIDSLNLHSNCFRGSPPKRIASIHMKENATAKLLKCRDSFYRIDRMRGRSDSVTLKKTTSDNWQDNPKSVDGSHQNQDIKRSNDVVFARKFFTSSTTPFTSSYSPALIDSNVSTNIM